MRSHGTRVLCCGAITLTLVLSERVQGCVIHADADLARKPSPPPSRNPPSRARPSRRRSSAVGPESRGGPCVSLPQRPNEMVLVLSLAPGGHWQFRESVASSTASSLAPSIPPRSAAVSTRSERMRESTGWGWPLRSCRRASMVHRGSASLIQRCPAGFQHSLLNGKIVFERIF
jgi:hypothetical protein